MISIYFTVWYIYLETSPFDAEIFIYLGFYVTFNTIQVIS